MNTRVTVLLAVAIGAAAAWLWTSRGVMPAAHRTAHVYSAVPQTRAPSSASNDSRSQPTGLSRESSGSHEAAPSTASITAPSVETTSGSRDDSTYDRMLAVAQTYPDWVGVDRDLTRIHERFVLTPDDPDWGRRMERALRDFFQARSRGSKLEVISISCRAAACEVQAQLMEEPFQGQTRDREEEKMLDPLREFWPVGPSLHNENFVDVRLADRIGFLVSYKRVEP